MGKSEIEQAEETQKLVEDILAGNVEQSNLYVLFGQALLSLRETASPSKTFVDETEQMLLSELRKGRAE